MLIPVATPGEKGVNFRATASTRASMADGNEALITWRGGIEPSGGGAVMSLNGREWLSLIGRAATLATQNPPRLQVLRSRAEPRRARNASLDGTCSGLVRSGSVPMRRAGWADALVRCRADWGKCLEIGMFPNRRSLSVDRTSEGTAGGSPTAGPSSRRKIERDGAVATRLEPDA